MHPLTLVSLNPYSSFNFRHPSFTFSSLLRTYSCFVTPLTHASLSYHSYVPSFIFRYVVGLFRSLFVEALNDAGLFLRSIWFCWPYRFVVLFFGAYLFLLFIYLFIYKLSFFFLALVSVFPLALLPWLKKELFTVTLFHHLPSHSLQHFLTLLTQFPHPFCMDFTCLSLIRSHFSFPSRVSNYHLTIHPFSSLSFTLPFPFLIIPFLYCSLFLSLLLLPPPLSYSCSLFPHNSSFLEVPSLSLHIFKH